MSYRHNTIRTPPQSPRAPAVQRSYVVNIDAGTFANVEIVVGDYHRGGVWTPSRAATVTAKGKGHSHVYGTPPVSAAKRRFVRDGLISSSSFLPLRPFAPRSFGGTTRHRQMHVDTIPSISVKRTPLSPLQSRSSPVPVPVPVSVSVSTAHSTSDGTRRKRTSHEREYAAAQRRMAEERTREQLQRRREAARLTEARRAAAAAEEEARQRRVEHQRREQQKQQQQMLREERRRLERAMRMREIANAWRSYEARWGLLSQRQPELGLLSALTFERIPWPVADAPLDRTLDELLRPEAIREFLLSPAHSPDVSSKDRIRAALRRWHPDKFSRVLSQVMESDREVVAEGMGIVIRCLNEMLERENHHV